MPVDVSEEEVNRTNKVLLADVGNSRTKLALVSGVSQGMPLLARQYELDSHNVVNSSEWAIAVEKGRWSSHVREHTSERSHYMYKYI